MQPQKEAKEVWNDLAELINSLPLEKQRYYQRNIAMLIHDLRQVLGIVYSAEGLLRRSRKDNADDLELLDMIHKSSSNALRLLTDFARPFDSEITLPISQAQDESES